MISRTKGGLIVGMALAAGVGLGVMSPVGLPSAHSEPLDEACANSEPVPYRACEAGYQAMFNGRELNVNCEDLYRRQAPGAPALQGSVAELSFVEGCQGAKRSLQYVTLAPEQLNG